MKLLYTIMLLFVATSLSAKRTVHPTPVNPKATKEAKALLERLYTNVDEGKIVSGLHHNQLNEPNYSRDLNRIAEASGKTPLIWGGDVAWDAAKVVEMATDHYNRGFVVTLMWHAPRPFDKGIVSFKNHTQGKITDQQWNDLLTPGTEMNLMWLAQVDSICQYLKVLQDRNIPVIWRPLHEMNGGWFWWGHRKGADGYQKLWRMLYERMTDYNGLNNLLWVWNANATQTHDTVGMMCLKDYYPGGDVVDILATDIYSDDWRQCHHDDLETLADGKLIAIGETGNLPTPEQLRAMPKFAWFMIWTTFTQDKYNSLKDIRDVFYMPNVITLPDDASKGTPLDNAAGREKVVLLDTHFNHEVDRKSGRLQHYTWDDKSKWGGYSQFGDMFVRNGGSLAMLDEAPTEALLDGSSVYIIVDPDHVKDNPKPNYMDERSAEAITAWVKKGGRLLVLTNDRDNCDLKYINILMDKFGLHYNDTTILQLEIPTKEKPENVYPLQGTLAGVDKMYMRGTSSIRCGKKAKPIVWTKDNDVIIAEAKYGKGLVVAIADPWIYNEYIGHTLLPDNYDNASPAELIVKRLMEK